MAFPPFVAGPLNSLWDVIETLLKFITHVNINAGSGGGETLITDLDEELDISLIPDGYYLRRSGMSIVGDAGLGGGGGSPLATPTVTGTVKTDVVEADPRVYVKASVDTLLGAKSNVGHNHNTLYYTQAQVDSLLAGLGDGTVFDIVEDYGADPTGVVDSTWAIQQAFNDSIAWGTESIPYGLKVRAPAGTYNITGPIVLRCRLGGEFFGEGPGATTFRWNGGPDNNYNRLASVFAMQECMDYTMRDFRITFGQIAYAGFTMETLFGYQLLSDGVTPTIQGFSTHNMFHNIHVENSNPERVLYGWALQPVVGGYNSIVPRVEELTSSSRFGIRQVGTSTTGHVTRPAGVAWVVDEHVGKYVEVWRGGSRQVRPIVSNSSDSLRVLGWDWLPGGTDTFRINLTDANSGGPGTYTVDSAQWPIVAHPGAGWIPVLYDSSFFVQQYADGSRNLSVIFNNTADTLYIQQLEGPLPAAGSDFYVGYQFRDANNEHHEIISCKTFHCLFAGVAIGHSQAKANRVLNGNFSYSGKCMILVVQGSVNCQGLSGGGMRFVHRNWTAGFVYKTNEYVRASNGFLYRNEGANAAAVAEPTIKQIGGFFADGTLNWKCITPISPETTLPLRPYDVIVINAWDPCEFSRSEAESSYGMYYGGGGMVQTLRSWRWSADKLQEGIDNFPDVVDNVAIACGSNTQISGIALSDAPDFAPPRIKNDYALVLSTVDFRTNQSHLISPITDDSLGEVKLENNTFYLGTQRTITDGIIRAWWNDQFITAHAAPTEISEIQGSTLFGHKFTVVIGDNNTTFVPGQYLLRDAEDWSPLQGSTITFLLDRITGLWTEVARTERVIPPDILGLADDIAALGASLFSIKDVRYHKVINSSDLITKVRDARFPAGGPEVVGPAGHIPAYDDVSAGQPFIAFSGNEQLITAISAPGLSTLTANMMLSVVGDPGAYVSEDILADFSPNDHNSYVRFGRYAGGFIRVYINNAINFDSTVALPAGVTVMHARRDQIDAANARAYARVGAAAETGHAVNQAAAVMSGFKQLSYGARYNATAYATGLKAKAFLTVNGVTNANAAAVQDVINTWADVVHGANL